MKKAAHKMLVKLRFVLNFTITSRLVFEQIYFRQNITYHTVSTLKLQKTLFYEKVARKNVGEMDTRSFICHRFWSRFSLTDFLLMAQKFGITSGCIMKFT